MKTPDSLPPHPQESIGAVSGGPELARLFNQDIKRRAQPRCKLSGLATGFPALDALLDGLQYGQQTIIAAQLSVGKTTLGLNIVEQVCLVDQIPTAIISLEMSGTELLRRLCAAHCHIPLRSLRAGSYAKGKFPKLTHFEATLQTAPLFLFDPLRGATAEHIAALVRRLVREQGVRFVLLDNVQKVKISGREAQRADEVGEASAILKAMAVENDIALLTLAHLNREPEQYEGRIPRLADLADSAQIERNADTIAILHRDRTHEGQHAPAALLVAKHRDGETGMVKLTFDGQHCRFNDPPLVEEGCGPVPKAA